MKRFSLVHSWVVVLEGLPHQAKAPDRGSNLAVAQSPRRFPVLLSCLLLTPQGQGDSGYMPVLLTYSSWVPSLGLSLMGFKSSETG